MSTVLVTGGSGFVGSHCIAQLLEAGHSVRTTVRSADRESYVCTMLDIAGVESAGRLSFHVADLERDDGWADAVAGCEFVLHVASPIPLGVPKSEDELIVPAREGALRVLRAARDAGASRVVMTSSSAAVAYGHEPSTGPFDESFWSDPNTKDLPAYHKSKIHAEHAAWDFIAKEGGAMTLATVNPVGVFGPVLGSDLSISIHLVKTLLDGMPGCPQIYFGVVDVRDVADLHLRAMTNEVAAGQRFLAVAGDSMSMLDAAKVLKNRLGARASNVPDKELPSWLVRSMALVMPALRQVVPDLGKIRNTTGAKARSLLGWNPRPNDDALVATAESLFAFGLVKGEKR